MTSSLVYHALCLAYKKHAYCTYVRVHVHVHRLWIQYTNLTPYDICSRRLSAQLHCWTESLWSRERVFMHVDRMWWHHWREKRTFFQWMNSRSLSLSGVDASACSSTFLRSRRNDITAIANADYIICAWRKRQFSQLNLVTPRIQGGEQSVYNPYFEELFDILATTILPPKPPTLSARPDIIHHCTGCVFKSSPSSVLSPLSFSPQANSTTSPTSRIQLLLSTWSLIESISTNLAQSSPPTWPITRVQKPSRVSRTSFPSYQHSQTRPPRTLHWEPS